MRTRTVWTSVVLLAATFAGWTYLALHTAWLSWLDYPSTTVGPAPTSLLGQVGAAIALIFDPWVVYPVVLIVGILAWRAGHERFTWAAVLAVILGVTADRYLKPYFGRERPPFKLPLITSEGLAYPSVHMVAITIAAVLMTVAWRVFGRAQLGLFTIGTFAVVVLIGWDRYIVRAHYTTDIVAGVLVGAVVALVCVGLTRPEVRPRRRPRRR